MLLLLIWAVSSTPVNSESSQKEKDWIRATLVLISIYWAGFCLLERAKLYKVGTAWFVLFNLALAVDLGVGATLDGG